MIWTGRMIADKIISEGEPVKVNPNGVDLGVSQVMRVPLEGRAVIHGKKREVEPGMQEVSLEGEFYVLTPGVYQVRVNCQVSIPQNAVGHCLPRSTLNRFGVIKSESAVWDSGYTGYGTCTVYVPVREVRIHKDEAWFQFIVFDAHEASEKYDGHWQGEK